MAATIVSKRHLEMDEVLSWHWRRFLQTYRQIGRSEWDAFIMDVQASELGVVRALGSAFGGKKPPKLPDYSSVNRNDAWEKPKPKMPSWMEKYCIANNIPIPE